MKMEIEGAAFKVKRIYQKDLTPDCWSIQFWGLPYCRRCEYLATDECGGQRIRKEIFTGEYPRNGLPEVREK